MFLDEAKVFFKAGNGGDGIISWRREKYIPKGGPYGGDGGRGGDIILQADTNINTLSDFRNKKKWIAENGERGYTKNMHGQNGEDLIIKLPVGTLIKNLKTNELIVDLATPFDQYVLCRGGRGGFGNAHFMSSTRQAPDFAEMGDRGEEEEVHLELKLVADIGIVGLPNAGKSTLIQSLTNVRPKIADYPFTTLVPNLGVMDYKGKSLVLEDVPGLIEGASEGKGLGKSFLKHIERASILLHVIDTSAGLEEAKEAYRVIKNEMNTYSELLAGKEEIILLNKIDVADKDIVKKCLAFFKKTYKDKTILTLSGAGHLGLEELKDILLEVFSKTESVQEKAKMKLEFIEKKEMVYDLTDEDAFSRRANIFREGNIFTVSQPRINQIVRMTNMENVSAVMRVYDVFEKTAILRRIVDIIYKDLQKEERHLDTGALFNEATGCVVRIEGREFSLSKALMGRKWFMDRAW